MPHPVPTLSRRRGVGSGARARSIRFPAAVSRRTGFPAQALHQQGVALEDEISTFLGRLVDAVEIGGGFENTGNIAFPQADIQQPETPRFIARGVQFKA